ncbi:MAG: STAS domain-containing protein [Candidatus Kapabacteria bacterium]|nr:STAS domain-containing protein [Candidatus Kapabacteria bacterium]
MGSDFIIENISGKENTSLVTFGSQLLGGNDALILISKLNELASKKIKYVIADLSKVEIINSSGLGMLVSALTTLKKYEIEFWLCCLPEKVQKLLEMTHLDKVFRIFENMENAIKNLE